MISVQGDATGRFGFLAILLVLLFGMTAFAEEPSEVTLAGTSEVQPAKLTESETSETQEAPPEPKEPEKKRFSMFAPDSPYMLGDWGGVRTDLEDVGLSFHLSYQNNFFANVKGGRTTNSAHHNDGTIDLLITVDLDKMELIEGGRILAHVKREWGNGINFYTGAIFQVQDDQDGDLDLYIDQLWYEQSLLDNRVKFRLGFLDYQTIVDRNLYANSEDKQFSHQMFDNNPLLPLNIGLGMALTVRPTPWLTLIGGIGDAQAIHWKPGFKTAFHDEAWFVTFFETGLHFDFPSPRGKLPGNYRFGLVYDPRPRTIFHDPDHALKGKDVRRGNDYGFYASFDQLVYRESSEDMQGLGMFFRYAYRHSDINRISVLWTVGAQYQGLIPTRDKDLLGFAVGQGRGSEKYHDRIDDQFENETVYELYYAIKVTDWLVITPDIQYLDNPGARGDYKDAVVLGLRTRISF